MMEMRHRWPDIEKQNEEQRTARMRMALFPDKAEVLYVDSEIWVVRTYLAVHTSLLWPTHVYDCRV